MKAAKVSVQLLTTYSDVDVYRVSARTHSHTTFQLRLHPLFDYIVGVSHILQDKGKDIAYGTGDGMLGDRKKVVSTRFDAPELVSFNTMLHVQQSHAYPKACSVLLCQQCGATVTTRAANCVLVDEAGGPRAGGVAAEIADCARRAR